MGCFLLVLLVVVAGGRLLTQALSWELELLHQLAHLRTPQSDARWADITAFGSAVGISLISVCAVVLWGLQRAWMKAACILLIALGSGGLTLGLKAIVMRPRPDIVAHGTAFANSSFPSGHALMSMAVAIGLVSLMLSAVRVPLRMVGVGLAIGVSLLIGFSRCYFGVHYPLDVLTGWLVGGVWAVFCLQLTKK